MTGLLVFAGGAQQRDAAVGQVSLGFPAREALVGDEGQAGPGGGELGLDVEHRGQDLALAGLRVGQRPQDRHPGRERPHSTGVESAIRTLPDQKSLSAARSRITCRTSGSTARSRLLQPGWCGRYRNMARRWQIANRIHRYFLGKPSSAWVATPILGTLAISVNASTHPCDQ